MAEDERVADGFVVAMNRVMTGERRSCKMETLQEADKMAKGNNGAPGEG